jgi:hypothetical protein
VPSSTIVWSNPSTPATGATQNHARAIRVLLEQLDDLARERNQLVSRAQRLADADDISTRIQKEAAGLESWTEVQPSMFEDTLDQELVKYDKFRHDIEEGAAKQTELLENVKECPPRQSIISDVMITSLSDPDGFFLAFPTGRPLRQGAGIRVAVSRLVLPQIQGNCPTP